MTIRHLRTFIKVVELGSISKAAIELNITQPSISQTIKELENYYNCSLFDRVNKKLILTVDGRNLLAKAKEVIASFDEFEYLANKTDYSPKVRIGATMTFGTFTLPNLILDLKKEIPNLDPYFYIDKIKGLEEKILNGDLDFAITEGLVKSKSIKMDIFGTDNLVAVKGNEYNAPNKLKLKDLLNYDLLVREVGSAPRNILDSEFNRIGLRITNPRMESVSNMIIVAMAIHNNGIGILPYHIVKRFVNEGSLQIIELDKKLERQLCIIHHKNKRFSIVERKAFKLTVKLLQNNVYSLDKDTIE